MKALTHPEPLSFTSGEGLRRLLESDAMPAPPKWKSAKIVLFGNPSFAKSMDYAPRRIFDATGQRVYHEFYTGNGCMPTLWGKSKVPHILGVGWPTRSISPWETSARMYEHRSTAKRISSWHTSPFFEGAKTVSCG